MRRAVTFVLAAEGLFLLVPWQAVAYGSFDLARNQDVVIWLGAPLALLGARATWAHGLGGWRGLALVLSSWLWLFAALVLNGDPHGFGPRRLLLLGLIGWVPVLNTGLVLGLGLARGQGLRRGEQKV